MTTPWVPATPASNKGVVFLPTAGIFLSDNDTATATDVGSNGNATQSANDTGTGVDAGVLSINKSDSDTATGAESQSFKLTNSATGVDAVQLIAVLTGIDTGHATEVGGVPQSKSDGDTATGADVAVVNFTKSDTDTATGTDAVNKLLLTVNDPGSGLEAGSADHSFPYLTSDGDVATGDDEVGQLKAANGTWTSDNSQQMNVIVTCSAVVSVINAVVPPPNGVNMIYLKQVNVVMPTPTLNSVGRPN